MKNVIFTKASLKTRREMGAWSCLARQRSGLLVIFLLLLALTIYKEFEGREEEEVLAVTGNEGGKMVKRIFEGEVRKDFEGNPGEFKTDVKLDSVKESNIEEGYVEQNDVEDGDIGEGDIGEGDTKEGDVVESDSEKRPGKTQPRCHFRAPTENR